MSGCGPSWHRVLRNALAVVFTRGFGGRLSLRRRSGWVVENGDF